ncbi:41810_t:CDS:2 [Gigaspora margarita]|uniref:41810_t:CDS:1 n=1 Tax=Gigaspora margarita TaxID=4874 RepID=A0ABN7UJL2_GIGMA|nr:41810_t:CDS:2 [Gigaspora margarita]
MEVNLRSYKHETRVYLPLPEIEESTTQHRKTARLGCCRSKQSTAMCEEILKIEGKAMKQGIGVPDGTEKLTRSRPEGQLKPKTDKTARQTRFQTGEHVRRNLGKLEYINRVAQIAINNKQCKKHM